MIRFFVIFFILNSSARATSFAGPSFNGSYADMPRFNANLFKDCDRGNGIDNNFPVYSGTPLAPEVGENLLGTLEMFPVNGDLTVDETKDILADLIEKLKDPKEPVFIDPVTGLPIFAGDLKPNRKKPRNRVDALEGCVTRTSTVCTGSGKDRTCETTSWEVCLKS